MEPTIEQALQQGVAAHREGKLQEAERLYRAILQSQPAHPDANHNLGVLAVSVNKAEAALPLFKTALEANPKIEQFWLSYIDALIKVEKVDDARRVLSDAQQAGVTAAKLQIFEEQLEFELSPSSQIPQQEINNPLHSHQGELSAAIELREAGKYKEAQEWLSKFVQHNPANPEALSLLSQVLLLDKKEAEAEKVLTAASSINSELPSVYRNQARFLLKQSKTVEALEKAQLGCRQSPEDSESLLVLAACLGANQRDLEALPLIEKILKAKSNYAEAYANRALIKLRAKDTVGAIEDAEMTVSLKPHLTQIWQLLSSLHYQANNLSDAIEALRRAHKNEPENTTFMIQLGEFLRQDNKASEAITILEQVTELAPEDANAWTNLGVAFQQEKRIAEAKIAYEKALALNPKSAAIVSKLTTIAVEAEEWESALRYCEKALEIKPDYAEAHSNLGNTLKELGRLDEALASYTQAIALKPDFAEAHSNLGNTLKELGRLDEALACYTQAIVLKPDFAEAHSNLGITLKELGRLDEALASYTQAIALKPDLAEAHNNLGIALQELDRLDEALASYTQAIALKPDFAEAFWNLSGCVKTIQGAEHWIDKCLIADTHHIKAKITKAALRFYQGDRNNFDELMQSELKQHSYMRSFAWVFSLPNLPELHFDKWCFFDAIVKKSITSKPFYEFGVWRASSFKYLIKVFKKGYGFDTFTGLPEDWHNENGSVAQKAGTYTSDGNVPKIKGGEFIVGKFEDTLPVFFSESRPMASVINFDADLYSSTICALNFSKSVMDKDTILIFDELIINESWEQDEFKALNEFCSINHFSYEVIAVSFFTKQVAVKLIGI